MWRYLVGAVAALLLAGAGVLWFNARARPDAVLPAQPVAALAPQQAASPPLPDTVPAATERTREEKRFDRYDRDRNGTVTRDEYLAQRHKAFAKLDTNHDGMLSFDEWAVKSETKFATADTDRSDTLTRTEFATTAMKRKPPRKIRCPQPTAPEAAPADEG